jgi:glycosyltransferase involved in cell wall biosynthesis
MNIVGAYPPKLLETMAEHEPSLRIHGFVDDVRVYFARSAVYVVPIRVGGGTRLKILDAFASGKAVVSTAVGCEGIDVTLSKDILVADDPEAFASTVVELLRDPAKRLQLEQNARRLAEEKYSWVVVGKGLLKLLEELCG